MQTPDEEDYSNEPPLLEGINRFDLWLARIGNWFQSHIQEDPRRFESSQIDRQRPRKWRGPRRPYHLLLRSVAPAASCRAFRRSSFLEGKNSIRIHVRLFLRRLHAHVHSFLACQSSYILLKLLSDSSSNTISLTSVMSILGYSMIPLLFLCLFSLVLSITFSFLFVFISSNILGWIVSVLCILWSSFSASRFIELLLGSTDQRYIIMYPLVLLYAVFALITVFWFLWLCFILSVYTLCLFHQTTLLVI